MSITTFLAIYFIIWWVVLFAVLPWGVRSQEESGEVTLGTDPGAPATHLVWRKLIWTTVIATVVFAFFYGLYRFDLLPLEYLKEISNPPHR
jgi:predicted secreted protein